MANNQVLGLPGPKTAREATYRVVTATGTLQFLPTGKIISGAVSRDPLNTGYLHTLRPGLLMGKITSGGEYAPSIIGVTTNAEASGSTSIEAAAAVVTELVRRVGSSGTFTLTGPPSANGTVVSETVTYSAASGTTITVTAITAAFVAGSFIQPTDGSQTPVTFIPDGTGIKVTDDTEANIDQEFPQVPVAGQIDSSQLINWPSDTSLQAWIEARLPFFVFDHGF